MPSVNAAVAESSRAGGSSGPDLLAGQRPALFARGLAAENAAIQAAIQGQPPGVDRLRAGGAAVVGWAVANPALAQLLHWRPVPGFHPSAETFAPSEHAMAELHSEFATAVRRGHLSRAADSDEAVRLWTVVLSGLISQQLANQPDAVFEQGQFSQLTSAAIDMFLSAYQPSRSSWCNSWTATR